MAKEIEPFKSGERKNSIALQSGEKWRKKKKLKMILPTFLLLINAIHTVYAATYYVSSSLGTSKGVVGDYKKPFKDIKAAIVKSKNGDTIKLYRGDVFSLPSPGGKLSSKRENLKFSSWGPESNPKPVITQSVKVPDALVEATTINGVSGFKLNLNSIMTDKDNKYVWALWINGVRYFIARYPNLVDENTRTGNNAQEFIFMAKPNPSLSDQMFPDTTTLKNFGTGYWIGSTIRIRNEGWSYQRNQITCENTNTKGFCLKDQLKSTQQNGFYLENKFEELDAPCEYFYNLQEKVLYYIACRSTPSNIESYNQGIWILPHGNYFKDAEDIYLSNPINKVSLDLTGEDVSRQSSTIFRIDSQNVSLRDIIFSRAFVGVYATESGFSISECEFRDMLSTGVLMKVKTSGTIQNSDFSDIDVTGIAGRPTDAVIDNVRMNRIALNVGSDQGAGVRCATQSSCTVKNSQFKKMGYAGVHFVFKGLIENNIFEDWAMTLADVGAIYLHTFSGTVRGNTINGKNYWNTASFNWFNHGFGAAIYVDDFSTSVTVENNVVNADANFGIRFNKGTGHVIKNNYCYNGGLVVVKTSTNNVVTGNTFVNVLPVGDWKRVLHIDYDFETKKAIKSSLVTGNTFILKNCTDQNLLTSLAHFNMELGPGNTKSCVMA